jgi:hypothetical protein
MYCVIVYCVLVASGFAYCVIHDHRAERHGLEKYSQTPIHLSDKTKS